MVKHTAGKDRYGLYSLPGKTKLELDFFEELIILFFTILQIPVFELSLGKAGILNL